MPGCCALLEVAVFLQVASYSILYDQTLSMRRGGSDRLPSPGLTIPGIPPSLGKLIFSYTIMACQCAHVVGLGNCCYCGKNTSYTADKVIYQGMYQGIRRLPFGVTMNHSPVSSFNYCCDNTNQPHCELTQQPYVDIEPSPASNFDRQLFSAATEVATQNDIKCSPTLFAEEQLTSTRKEQYLIQLPGETQQPQVRHSNHTH